jgi:hypothetical protein
MLEEKGQQARAVGLEAECGPEHELAIGAEYTNLPHEREQLRLLDRKHQAVVAQILLEEPFLEFQMGLDPRRELQAGDVARRALAGCGGNEDHGREQDRGEARVRPTRSVSHGTPLRSRCTQPGACRNVGRPAPYSGPGSSGRRAPGWPGLHRGFRNATDIPLNAARGR